MPGFSGRDVGLRNFGRGAAIVVVLLGSDIEVAVLVVVNEFVVTAVLTETDIGEEDDFGDAGER